MIQREWKTVAYRTFEEGLDEYGQKRQKTYFDTPIEVVLKQFSHRNVDNPNYSDIEFVCLIKNNSAITDANAIIVGSKQYNIKYLIPSGKYTQLLLYECK